MSVGGCVCSGRNRVQGLTEVTAVKHDDKERRISWANTCKRKSLWVLYICAVLGDSTYLSDRSRVSGSSD